MAICSLKDCHPLFSNAPNTKDGQTTFYSVAPCGRIGGCKGPSLTELQTYDQTVGQQLGVTSRARLQATFEDGSYRLWTTEGGIQRAGRPRKLPSLSIAKREQAITNVRKTIPSMSFEPSDEDF